ncbi:hypothetical protein PHJA_002562800 [Phtheirospermum japonicum]|uniref:Uncharacterized protein n=1 Tax=Phtheirospermum japonicum TaxID=374723 RepID=A0A830D2T5_9LAMI|nr:hypothetical protein PHJA_002562800 [Phtheirospermum japonicum]
MAVMDRKAYEIELHLKRLDEEVERRHISAPTPTSAAALTDSGVLQSMNFMDMISSGLNGQLAEKKKENGKRRKDDHNSRKNKDKKEKVIDPLAKSSQGASRSNGPPYVQSIMMDSDDGISYDAIGGATGQLLEQNGHALDQISANFSAFKIHENIDLFCQARNNILSILNEYVLGALPLTFNDLPEIMKQMPPLPVKLNEELASSILPRTPLPKKA